jgi:hypothetical protein
MKKFKLEVGGKCFNGADVVFVHRGRESGVVCASWRQEYVTWVFPLGMEDSTSNGNYFLYGNGHGTMEEALERAKENYVARVAKYL